MRVCVNGRRTRHLAHKGSDENMLGRPWVEPLRFPKGADRGIGLLKDPGVFGMPARRRRAEHVGECLPSGR